MEEVKGHFDIGEAKVLSFTVEQIHAELKILKQKI